MNSFTEETSRVSTNHLVDKHHCTPLRVISEIAALVFHIPLRGGPDNCVSELVELRTIPCTIKPAGIGRQPVQLIGVISQNIQVFGNASCLLSLPAQA